MNTGDTAKQLVRRQLVAFDSLSTQRCATIVSKTDTDEIRKIQFYCFLLLPACDSVFQSFFVPNNLLLPAKSQFVNAKADDNYFPLLCNGINFLFGFQNHKIMFYAISRIKLMRTTPLT